MTGASRKTTVKSKAAARAKAPDKKYYSRAAAKALHILDLLSASPQPMALNELTLLVKLTKTSLFRLLYTLEFEGAVEKDATGRYSLKANPAKPMNRHYLETVLDAGTAQLRDLVREYRETASLAFLFDNHIEVIAVVESPQIVRMGNTAGRILQPHASSLGKCITAFQRDERREHLIRSYGITAITPHTITGEQALHQELEQTRGRGYGLDREETCAGGFCFGAPILAPDGFAVAAISVSVPKQRLGASAAQQKLIESVRQAAGRVTAALATPRQ
jgi:IclR family acetate operon transcriptional repressor